MLPWHTSLDGQIPKASFQCANQRNAPVHGRCKMASDEVWVFLFFIHSYEPLHSENHFLREEGKKNDKDFPSAEGDH